MGTEKESVTLCTAEVTQMYWEWNMADKQTHTGEKTLIKMGLFFLRAGRSALFCGGQPGSCCISGMNGGGRHQLSAQPWRERRRSEWGQVTLLLHWLSPGWLFRSYRRLVVHRLLWPARCWETSLFIDLFLLTFTQPPHLQPVWPSASHAYQVTPYAPSGTWRASQRFTVLLTMRKPKA